MRSPFMTERARDQVDRILEHACFPGLGLLLDRDRLVVAAHGGAEGTGVHGVADVFGARPDASLVIEAHTLTDGLRVQRHELRAGYILVIAVPCEVILRTDRIDRAVALLDRMLVVGGVMGSGSPGDSGSGAPALVGLDRIIER